jgi:2-haloacid dehalogenase
MKYEFLLFDADGTLLDFKKSEAEALIEAMEKNGIQPSEERVALYSEINDSLWKRLERGEIEKKVLLYHRFELLFEALGITGDAKKMAMDYMNGLSTKGYVLEGAEQMCRSLYGKAKMYIVTNGVEFIQRGRYAVCGIDKYFDDVFISDVIGVEKPSVGYFEYVAAHIDGFDPQKALIIGHSLTSDMRGGLNYGIDTCWYNPAKKSCPTDMRLTFIANSFDDVIDFITKEENI